MSDEDGSQVGLLRGFDEVSYFGITQRHRAIWKCCVVTFISQVAEGIFVKRHNLTNSRDISSDDLEVEGSAHKRE